MFAHEIHEKRETLRIKNINGYCFLWTFRVVSRV
jgi:hypothetical protein